jgi:hypothetical protein
MPTATTSLMQPEQESKMLVMLSLTYPGDEGSIILDIWNLEAPSVAAVERLVREELGPALRRHGRSKAIELGFDECEFCPQALGIGIERTPLCTLGGLLADLADQRGVASLDDDLIRRCARPLQASREPAQIDDLLTRHGIADPRGRRLPYRKPKPKAQPSVFDDTDDDAPPF